MKSAAKLFSLLIFSLALTACEPVSLTPNIYSPTPIIHTTTPMPTSIPSISTEMPLLTITLSSTFTIPVITTATITPTQTRTPTPTLTRTPTPTKTSTTTATPTPTLTSTRTPTLTVTLTQTQRPTQTVTLTQTRRPTQTITPTQTVRPAQTSTMIAEVAPTDVAVVGATNPLTIEYLREQTYAAEITFEEQLADKENYEQYIVSYQSEGLKIYALLTVPFGSAPANGWPVIVFNHGYIPHYEYTSTGYYQKYIEALASDGFIVLSSDYRGHGDSEGTASGVYSVPDYTIDVLNAVSAMKIFEGADADRIGIWGHSMGGYISLRAMVVDPDIKAGVIWGGVVGSYADLCEYWFRCGSYLSGKSFSDSSGTMATMGAPTQNPDFWDTASANTYLIEMNTPIQLHHSAYDNYVPARLSRILHEELLALGKEAELHIYPITDHNISTMPYFDEAMMRTLEFYAEHLK